MSSIRRGEKVAGIGRSNLGLECSGTGDLRIFALGVRLDSATTTEFLANLENSFPCLFVISCFRDPFFLITKTRNHEKDQPRVLLGAPRGRRLSFRARPKTIDGSSILCSPDRE